MTDEREPELEDVLRPVLEDMDRVKLDTQTVRMTGRFLWLRWELLIKR